MTHTLMAFARAAVVWATCILASSQLAEGECRDWLNLRPANNNAATDRGHDEYPALATDGKGVWVAVWMSNDDLGGPIGTDWDILLAISTDDGLTWTDPVALNDAASDSGADWYPQVATDGLGNWVVVWMSSDDLDGAIGSDWDILASRSFDNGWTWTAPTYVNDNAAEDSGDDHQPQITSDGPGAWVVSWFSNDSLGGTVGTDFDLFFSKSDDNGDSWTSPMPINSNAAIDTGDDWTVQIKTDGSGNWIAAWHSGDSLLGTIGSDQDILIASSYDRGTAWTDPRPLNTNASTDTGEDVAVRLATDRKGMWLAAWLSTDDLQGNIGSDWDVLVARSSDGGATWTQPVPLSSKALTDNYNEYYVDLATDGAGTWVALWTSLDPLGTPGIGLDSDIVFSVSVNSGANWTEPRPVSSSATTDSGMDRWPRVAVSGRGTWLAIWSAFEALGDQGGDEDIVVTNMSCHTPERAVEVDIKPGSYPNSINLGSYGVIPVAILTTKDFDATTVDPDTVELAGSAVAIRGNGNRTLASLEDVNGDGYIDLMLHVETENLSLETGATEAVLTGETYEGELIEGSDSIMIVNE